MAFASTLQGDWSSGIYRGKRAPRDAAYDIVNGLIDDEGQVYKRGGSAYRSVSDHASTPQSLYALYMRAPATNRILTTSTPTGVLVALDGSSAPVSLGGIVDIRSRPASIGDYAVFATGTTTILLYAGSLKSTYITGTVSVTNGSATVTGSGTSWSANADAGMILTVGTDGPAVVKSVDSNTQITLTAAWAGSTAAGHVYSLGPTLSESLSAVTASSARTYVTAAGAGTPRLLLASGNRVYFTGRGDLTFSASDYHELPANVNIIGGEGRGDSAVIFTTNGVWEIGNLSLDPVDDFGNIQHTVDQITGDLVLWDDYGITKWADGLILPAVDDVYVAGSGFNLTSVSERIRPLYRSYVKAGYQPGLAAVHRGHLMLPILNGTTLVDVLVCRLDREQAWARWSGHAAGAAYATLIEEAARQPKLLGLAGKRVTDLTGCFDPDASNSTDADSTAPTFQVTTRDYPTGQQPGFVDRVRGRYEMVGQGIPDTFNRTSLGSDWTDNPWGNTNFGLRIDSDQLAGDAGGIDARSWLNTHPLTAPLSTSLALKHRPLANVDALVYASLGFTDQAAPGGYEARFRFESAADAVAIYRYDSSAATRILSPVSLGSRLAVDDLLGFTVATDGTLTATVNGATIGSVTDTTYFHAGETAHYMVGIVDGAGGGGIRLDSVLPAATVECSSDQDGGVFTALTDVGEQAGGSGWTVSDGSKYQFAKVGRKRERIRFRVTVADACSSFVLRSLEMLTRPSGRQ